MIFPCPMNQVQPSSKPSRLVRKFRKLSHDPKRFVMDSSGFRIAHRSWRRSLKLGSFLWVVGIFCIAVLYFGVMVSDRYVSRADVLVKQADQIKMLPEALSILGVGGSSHQDVLLIQHYLQSWDLLSTLDRELDLKGHYQSHQADFFSRLSGDASREDFIEYYRKHLTLHLDDLSGVLTIELQTFDPDYSQRVVTLMLKESEQFINRLGHKMALDQLAFVEKEADRAYQRVQTEKNKVLAFQNSHQLLSPESTSSAQVGMINQIEAELVRQQTELKRLKSYMKSTAPQVVAVETSVNALNKQLQQEQGKLTGVDKDAMNEITASYQEVQARASLAADFYKTSLISLEQARVEAYRKIKHLLVISQPTLADKAEYPRRLYNLATVGVLLCLFYGLVVMGLATLREHQD